jgi:N-acyl-D-aspartate/D-glutamate deacylase
VLDLVIRNGVVIDGTGARRQRADLGILHGRIVEMGTVTAAAAQVVDAGGHIVSPGFIDIHTHYDAQVYWDPDLTPSSLHGVTTVVFGNCGLTLAPIADDNFEYTLKMLSRVEGMPAISLRAGVPWGAWHSFSEYLDSIRDRIAVNAAVLVGHSALRLTVMGGDFRREATPEEIAALVSLLEESLDAGGLGLSTSYSRFHNDGDGAPIPSRYASKAELLALSAAVGRHPGTTLQISGSLAPFDEREMSLMTEMSLAADRPINWNSLMVSSGMWKAGEHNLAVSDYAADRGASVFALTFAVAPTTRYNFASGVLLDTLPGWGPIFEETNLAARAAILRNQDVRNVLAAGAASAETMTAYTSWAEHTIGQTFSKENRGLAGRRIGEIADERGQTPFDCMLDIVLADDLRTVLVTLPNGDDDESWSLRAKVFRDPRVVIGASDAGAHLDMIDAFAYTTDVLGPSVRSRKLFSLEEAVRLITDVPARAYGFAGRGRIAVGHHADLVVFDPDRIGPGDIHLRDDLPGGASRLYMVAEGVDSVFVAGKEVVHGQELTGHRSGALLSSGKDTTTVHADHLPTRISRP